MEYQENSYIASKRRDCLKSMFGNTLKRTSYHQRIENRNIDIVNDVTTDLISHIQQPNIKFEEKFFVKVSHRSHYQVYFYINIGHENSSLYIHKNSKISCMLSADAETKKIWKKASTYVDGPLDGISYLNANTVRACLHSCILKSIKEYTNTTLFKKQQQKYGIDIITLDDICKITVNLSNYNYSKTKAITLVCIPTVLIPKYCVPYVEQWMGKHIPCLIAVPDSISMSSLPELEWTVSYHEKEKSILETFPIRNALEVLHGVLVFIASDTVLETLTRDIITHQFLQIIIHMSRWIENHYEKNQELKTQDLICLI